MLEAVRLYKEQGKYGGIDWERVAKHMDYTRSKQNCKNKYRRYRANQVVENKIEFLDTRWGMFYCYNESMMRW